MAFAGRVGAVFAPCPSGSAWPASYDPDRAFDVHIISKSVLSTAARAPAMIRTF